MIVNKNRENGILFNNTHSSQQMDKFDHNKKKAAKSGSIYSGNLNLFQDDITMKKVMAHKKALKTVLDTYANDARINDNIESRRQRIEKLQDEYKEYTKELDNIEDKKQQLKEKYGISDNLEESAASPELLSEYEMLVSEYDKMAEEFQKKMNDSRYLMTEESKVINDIALERLKTDPMVAAGKKADAILEEAGQEIIGMVFDDTKEKIDKDMKEQKEKAKEKAKEEEEERLRLEALREEKEEKEGKEKKRNTSSTGDIINSQLLNQIAEADIARGKLETEIKSMLNTQVVLEEDMKGMGVDKQL